MCKNDTCYGNIHLSKLIMTVTKSLYMVCLNSYLVNQLGLLIFFLFMQVWGTVIMQKKYKGKDYFLALLVTLGCSVFILYPVMTMALVSVSITILVRHVHVNDHNRDLILTAGILKYIWLELFIINPI